MRVHTWLPALVVVALAAGCGGGAVVPPAQSEAQKVRLTDAAPTIMPLATTVAGDGNPMRVLPLVEVLNSAWKPLIINLAKPAKAALPWGNVGIQLIGKGDLPAAYCQLASDFSLDLAHGIYCLAPSGNSAQATYSNILVPVGQLENELKLARGDKKLGVSLMVAYFYALHLRQLLRLGNVITGSWNDASQTQWCLTGIGLRALGVFALPSPVPTLASASPAPELLPMGLTHVFSGASVTSDHEVWVVEGFASGSVNDCFQK